MPPHAPLRALTGARIFTGDRFLDDYAVLLDGGRIADVLPAAALPPGVGSEDLGGGLLAPGFLDAQVNGGGGVLFNDAPTADGAAGVAAAHRPTGTTGCLPTFITGRPDRQALAVAAVREAVAARRPGVLGIHLEGPHLSVARKGAHDPALIRPMSDADLDALLSTGLDTVLVTVAAETVSPAQVRRLADGGVVVSVGHSDATTDQVRTAADAGARCVTHLFNAMSPLAHRAPGVVGAALDDGRLWGGIIADGVHVDAVALRAALRAKRGPARLFLVSDAMPPAGSPGDTFTLSGRTVTRHGGALSFDDGTLAGADLTMDAALRFAVRELEQPLGEALRMASLYPAEMLGQGGVRGRIAAGYAADLVLLTEALDVRRTWIEGST
ncbi:N-acetylglucosamine-6-phosphate deacetylase [Lichenibacterium dinghuense]|uniref:N-acetylglucosamine-6-phosphate deacetylase n=1 Tax=Lichenibacterium dinghuense TaxID=2895977 RepID=UPI001F01F93F|nr:N-acetylglucosamine-6-phosphate deacetylase [Lichenibacterium sp. 6Y81]